MENTRRKKIIRLCRTICMAFIFLIPVLLALRLLFDLNGLSDNNSSHLSVTRQYIYYAVTIIKCSMYMYGLIILRRLFSLYEKAIFYSKDNVTCYKSIGLTLILIGLLNFITKTGIGAMINSPPDQIILSVSFLINLLPSLLPGLLLLLISRVTDEGRKIAEEQNQFL
jgi:hypothetical protein